MDNYSKHIGYLLNYLENEKDVTKLEEVKPQYIKQYIIEKQKAGNKPNYINDLIKVYKTLFKYLYDEGLSLIHILLQRQCLTFSEKNSEII